MNRVASLTGSTYELHFILLFEMHSADVGRYPMFIRSHVCAYLAECMSMGSHVTNRSHLDYICGRFFSVPVRKHNCLIEPLRTCSVVLSSANSSITSYLHGRHSLWRYVLVFEHAEARLLSVLSVFRRFWPCTCSVVLSSATLRQPPTCVGGILSGEMYLSSSTLEQDYFTLCSSVSRRFCPCT